MITLYALFSMRGAATLVNTYRTLNAAKSAVTQKLGGWRATSTQPWSESGGVWKRQHYRIVPVAVSVPSK